MGRRILPLLLVLFLVACSPTEQAEQLPEDGIALVSAEQAETFCANRGGNLTTLEQLTIAIYEGFIELGSASWVNNEGEYMILEPDADDPRYPESGELAAFRCAMPAQ